MELARVERHGKAVSPMSLLLDISQAEAQLNAYLARVADPVPFFDYVGDHEKHLIQERIMHTKEDPEGRPWIPWAVYTAEKRHALGNPSQGIMWDTSVLLDSIKFEVDGAYGVDIGTDVWYAQKHQEGEGKIPKREIFGWEDNMLPHYAQAFANYLETGRP